MSSVQNSEHFWNSEKIEVAKITETATKYWNSEPFLKSGKRMKQRKMLIRGKLVITEIAKNFKILEKYQNCGKY